MEAVVELLDKNFDPHRVTVGVVETAFPTPAGSIQPELIFVQAPSNNTLSVIVGKTGVLADMSAGGFEFPPGANFTLPVNVWKDLKCIASGIGQKLLVTYVWGPN